MLLALLVAVLGPDYHADSQCLVNVGCAAAREPGVPNPKPVAPCANRAPALTMAAALHEATTGWRRFFGWIWVPRVRIAAQLRGRASATTVVLCRPKLCCNRVSGNLVLADSGTGVELPVTTRTGREALDDVQWRHSSCVGDDSRLCCEYEPTIQVVADGRLVHEGQQHWHLEAVSLCAP